MKSGFMITILTLKGRKKHEKAPLLSSISHNCRSTLSFMEHNINFNKDSFSDWYRWWNWVQLSNIIIGWRVRMRYLPPMCCNLHLNVYAMHVCHRIDSIEVGPLRLIQLIGLSVPMVNQFHKLLLSILTNVRACCFFVFFSLFAMSA